MFVSEIVGSIIPMLFTPVPSTLIYQRYLPYFKERGWDVNLHRLNGKLFPFLEMNEGAINDYLDAQRFMFMLNAQYRSKSFNLFGNSRVSKAFLENARNGFEGFVNKFKEEVSDEPYGLVRRSDSLPIL